jgi:hypothetical protein
MCFRYKSLVLGIFFFSLLGLRVLKDDRVLTVSGNAQSASQTQAYFGEQLWTNPELTVVMFHVCMVLAFKGFFFFCGTVVWTQGLHLEPLRQSFFCDGFFRDRVFFPIFSQTGFEPRSSWSLPPELLRLQAPQLILGFKLRTLVATGRFSHARAMTPAHLSRVISALGALTAGRAAHGVQA